MKDKLRQLKERLKNRMEERQIGHETSKSSAADNRAPSEQIIYDSRQVPTGGIRKEDQTEAAESSRSTAYSAPLPDPSGKDTASLTASNVDISDWAGIWSEAYETVKGNTEYLSLLGKFEGFLEEGAGIVGNADEDDPSGNLFPAAGDKNRLKNIQQIAKEKLNDLSEAQLSFAIGKRSIVVRDSIVKTVKVINTLKPIISGAVAAEPSAGLAWAGVTTILPMLESIFQQDEDAATGLTEITFLMARYQMLHEGDFSTGLGSTGHSSASKALLTHVKHDLIGIYADMYVYEARFILQYATRGKVHRTFRNAFTVDDWKSLWAGIQSKSRRIDQGIHDQISARTMEIWKKVERIQMDTKIIEVITKDTLKVVQGLDRRQLLQSLKITGNAIFDSRETTSVATPCLRGTQLQTLKTIQEWAEDPDGEMTLWLEGMAGTGKTSISMTVARALKEGKPFTDQLEPLRKAFLGASFFFKNGDATRKSTVEFFTTIAWCLSDVFSDPDSPFTKAIKDNPGIETKAPQQQFLKLIAEPLSLLDKDKFISFQLIVVVDALDECDDAETLLAIIGNLQGLLQIRLRFFITSRREEHISNGFRRLHSQPFRPVNLKKVESSPGEADDITLYLSKTLKEIATRYDAQGSGIGDVDIKKLAEKADGLFIYAVTACRFLNAPDFADQESRNIRLKLILEDIEGPQQEVDSIYLTVLKFPDVERQNKALRVPFYSKILRLIGLIVVSLRPVSVETLCKLLLTTRKELDYHLRYLHPIIDVPNDPSAPISLVHLSFRDFILSETRSERLSFSVKEPVIHREMFDRCLEIIHSELREDICLLTLPGTFVSEVKSSQIEAHVPQYLRYACRYWVDHLKKIDRDDLQKSGLNDDDGPVHRFFQNNLLYWLEPSKQPELQSFLHDAKRFIQSNRWIIENAPLQMYCSALLFCPTKSKVRFYYESLIPTWIIKQPETQESWGPELYTLQGHSGAVLEIRFSPTQSLLASTSTDNTTRVWNYDTGSEQCKFQDPGTPRCVCFSMDGLRLASGCLDGTINVRDLRKATNISFCCPSGVVQITFSPTASNILASLCDDGKLRIWNLDDRQQGPVQHAWKPDSSRGFVFSPDGHFIGVHQGNLVALFNVRLGEPTSEFMVMDQVTTMAFSIDSSIIAVRLEKGVDFWDISLSEPRLIKSYEATSSNCSPFLFLSPDKTLTIHQRHSGTIEIRDASTGDLIGKFLKDFGKSFSPDGTLMAAEASFHPVIQIFSDPSATLLYQQMYSAPKYIGFISGDSVALSYSSRQATKRWNVAEESMHPLQDYVIRVIFSPDREFVVLQLSQRDMFQVWDKSLMHLQATFDGMADIAFIPHTGELATLSLLGDFEVLSQDAESHSFKPIRSFGLRDVVFEKIPQINPWDVTTLHISPSGQEAVVNVPNPTPDSHGRKSCQLWNIAENTIFSPENDFFGVQGRYTQLFHMPSGEEVHNCDLRDCHFLTFHPTDRTFAVVSKYDHTIVIWQGSPWVRRFMLKVPQDYEVRNLAFSATGRIAALSTSRNAGSSTIDIWDVATEQKLGSQVFGGVYQCLSNMQRRKDRDDRGKDYITVSTY
ncbi:hypothetical protein FHETE_4423 [Fusarium heterosporum]|uniref:NWD NACHT-NTPase N-terminal domain-containing protein n=1 Tax=Fusarium heterosporum TaxID=42747 RepID=A0A8H5WSH1_FUSHE|nr:hypothetical protein FHETE_4423 [Fusarium heterosporum]